MEYQAYWAELMQGAVENPERSIRINGVHYWRYNQEVDGRSFLPFGGRKFQIRYIEKSGVELTLMWYNGPIPSEIQWLLPDNAEWVK